MLARPFVRPRTSQEGLLPLKVFKLAHEERAWLEDCAGNLSNYRLSPGPAPQIFNVACSALVAINNLSDDQRTHGLTAMVSSMDSYLLRLDFTITDMSSECGWTTNRPVYLWVVGSRSLVRATIQRSQHHCGDRPSIRLVAPAWAHRSLLVDCSTYGTMEPSAHSRPLGRILRWC